MAQPVDELVRSIQVLGRIINVQHGQKIIRLDRCLWRIISLIWFKVAPIAHLLFLLTKIDKRSIFFIFLRLQELKSYRILAKKIIGKNVCYRIATAKDVPDLSLHYGYERFPELKNPTETFAKQFENLEGYGYILIADIGGKISGTALISKAFENKAVCSDWWLSSMLVRIRYRGAGIGEGLVKRALKKAVENDAARINLLVFEQNRQAINLYCKMGFRQTVIPKFDELLEKEMQQGNFRRIMMSKPLK